jgi:type II secretory pathway pseudopilin PulG
MFIKLKQSNSRGFTIVETLIVLAVTGMMFLSTSLLVRGQIERNRYQDSMRQLQQLVQNTINDVGNGYITTTQGGATESLLIGKKFWFCSDNFNPGSDWDGCPASGDGTKLYTATLQENNTGVASQTNTSAVTLPGAIKFTHFKTVNTTGVVNSGPVYEFGSRVMFTDSKTNGGNFLKIGRDINSTPTVQLFSRQNWWGFVNGTLSQQNEGGFMLCFEGNKKGSLELGSKKAGLVVELNMEDTRCN